MPSKKDPFFYTSANASPIKEDKDFTKQWAPITTHMRHLFLFKPYTSNFVFFENFIRFLFTCLLLQTLKSKM